MDIQEIVKKITSDKDLTGMTGKLLKDPTGTVKEVAGVDLPAEKVDEVLKAVKEKGAGLPGADVLGNLGGLFKK